MISIAWWGIVLIVIGSFAFGWIVLCCLAGGSFRNGIIGKREVDKCERKTNSDTETERADSQ